MAKIKATKDKGQQWSKTKHCFIGLMFLKQNLCVL
jgi:hypothetical protein